MSEFIFYEKGLEQFVNVQVKECLVFETNETSFFFLDNHDKKFKIHFLNSDNSVDLNYLDHISIFKDDLSFSDENILSVDFFTVETPFGFLEFISGGFHNSFFYMDKKNQDILDKNSYMPEFLKKREPFKYKGYSIYWDDNVYNYNDRLFGKNFSISTEESNIKEHIDFIIENKKYLKCDLNYYRSLGFTIDIEEKDIDHLFDFKLNLIFPDGSDLVCRNLDAYEKIVDNLKFFFKNIKELNEYASFQASLYLLKEKESFDTSDFSYKDFYRFKDLY